MGSRRQPLVLIYNEMITSVPMDESFPSARFLAAQLGPDDYSRGDRIAAVVVISVLVAIGLTVWVVS